MKISVTITSTLNHELVPSTLRPDELEAVHGGQSLCPDADGIVPEERGVYGKGWQGEARLISKEGAPCQWAIRYDTAEMAGAGPNDWSRLIAHERAHTRGWDHGEGTPGTNPAYWRSVRITGR
jgi:hypothetical protein